MYGFYSHAVFFFNPLPHYDFFKFVYNFRDHGGREAQKSNNFNFVYGVKIRAKLGGSNSGKWLGGPGEEGVNRVKDWG